MKIEESICDLFESPQVLLNDTRRGTGNRG